MQDCLCTNSRAAFLLGATLVSVDESGPVDRGARISAALRARVLACDRATVIPLTQGEVLGELGAEATSCMVLPWYDRERIESFVVLLAGGGVGTLEVWAEEPSAEEAFPMRLRLLAGHFGELQEFLRVSVGTRFSWGDGLPGRAAARSDCVTFPTLEESSGFLRTEAAKTVGLRCGFALPVPRPSGTDIATVLLGANDAQRCRIDMWHAGAQMSHCAEPAIGDESNVQLLLARRLASSMSRTGKPEVLFEDAESRFAVGWIARGFTSVPRMLTVVT